TIGAEVGYLFAFEFDGELAHAGNVAFRDDYVIEGLKARVDLSVAPQVGVKHGAPVNLVAVLAPAVQCGVEVGETDFGEEAQEAQINAEKGRAGGGEYARHGKQRPVSTENDDQGRGMAGQLQAGE